MNRISILTAFFNEEQSLPAFRERLRDVLRQADGEYEIVLVDDHSTDASSEFARQWALDESNVCYLRLARNCGSHAAFSAALSVCTGDCAVLLAADLQDPPETIPRLLEEWRKGHDVVWAARAAREGESWSTLFFSRAYYRIMRRLALPNMPPTGADFLLLDRKVINAYNAIPEKNTSLLAMILWMGFRQTTIDYVKQARHAGRSKWTFSKKLKLAVDSIVSFSSAPIRWISVLGLLMATCGFLYALIVLIGRLTGWITAGTGFAALMTVLLVGQGTIMIMLGVLGEYLWRTFDEARGRPRYLVDEHLNGGSVDTSEVQAEGRSSPADVDTAVLGATAHDEQPLSRPEN